MSVVEGAVNVLVAFEEELKGAKDEATEARKRFLATVADQGAKTRAEVLSRAGDRANETIQRARKDAEAEAAKTLAEGEASLEALKGSLTKNRAKATAAVTAHLLGQK